MTIKETGFSIERQNMGFQPPPLTGDDITDRCFHLEFIPLQDDRIGSRMDGLKNVPGLVKQGFLDEARIILDDHQNAYPDLDFIYAFKALILQKKGQADAAKEILQEGLRFGKSKFILYERLGFLFFKAGQLSEAVNYWIKCIVAMVMIGRVSMWEPFLYLAYVARFLSNESYYRKLMDKVMTLSPYGELELDDPAKKQIHDAAANLSAASILKAIELLFAYYLDPPASVEPTPFLTHLPAAVEPVPSPTDPRPPSHPNVPATRDPLSSFHTLFGQQKKNRWVKRLMIMVITLTFILILVQFLKFSTEREAPVIRQIPEPVMEQKDLSSEPRTQNQHTLVKPTEPAGAQAQPPKEGTGAEPDLSGETAQNKEKSAFLKPKTKTAHPDIKRKE